MPIKKLLITIVVPVYNGSKYLPELIKNLRNQTYKKLEILMVDDLSTDDSAKIIKSVIKQDNRFKLISRTTKGGTAVSGQEYALPFCSGDYYFFMSQDDLIDDDLLEKCLKKAIDTGAEVVMPNMVLYYESKPKNKALKYPLNDDYNSVLDPKTAFELSLDWQIHCFVLRKTELVRRVGIKAEYYNSDEFFGRLSLLCSNKIVFVDTNFYYRQDNPDAITKTIKYFTIDVMTTDLMLLDLAIKNKCDINIIRERIRVLRGSFTWWAKRIYSKQWNKQQRKYIKNSCRKAFKRLSWLSLRYFVFNKTLAFFIRGIKCI